MQHGLDAIRIVLDLAVLYMVIRGLGWMFLVNPRAWWRGWAAENRGDKKNPYKFGTWDYAAWRDGHEVSEEVDPGK